MVNAATDTAVSASISMPVCAAIFAEAVIMILFCFTEKFTSQWVRGRGWQSGMSSPVFLAALIPAMRAVARTLPFAIVFFWIARMVAGRKMISPDAIASRETTG